MKSEELDSVVTCRFRWEHWPAEHKQSDNASISGLIEPETADQRESLKFSSEKKVTNSWGRELKVAPVILE